MIRVELAGVPVGKGRPRFVRATGHTYTPEKTRNFESDLRYAAQVAMAGKPPMTGPVSCFVKVFLPIPPSWSKKRREAALSGVELPAKRPDWDNYIKGASDALNEIVWQDDCQVVEGTFAKQYSDRPRMVIEVASLSPNKQ